MDFCNEYKPPAPPVEQNEPSVHDTSQQYQQQSVHRSERLTFDLNVPPSESSYSEHPGENHPFYDNQPSISISYLDKSKNLDFDLNELPPPEYNENSEDKEN